MAPRPGGMGGVGFDFAETEKLHEPQRRGALRTYRQQEMVDASFEHAARLPIERAQSYGQCSDPGPILNLRTGPPAPVGKLPAFKQAPGALEGFGRCFIAVECEHGVGSRLQPGGLPGEIPPAAVRVLSLQKELAPPCEIHLGHALQSADRSGTLVRACRVRAEDVTLACRYWACEGVPLKSIYELCVCTAIVLALILIATIWHLGERSMIACVFLGAFFIHTGSRPPRRPLFAAVLAGVCFAGAYTLLGGGLGTTLVVGVVGAGAV